MSERMDFERKLPTEEADTAELVKAFLIIQARFAAAQKRLPGRGTHTKGVCLRGTFEVFDLARTIGDPALAARLARGVFAAPGVYPATVRFANAASTIKRDSDHDVRALSFFIERPSAAGVSRADFTMNNAPTFPINDVHAFAVLMRLQSAGGLFSKLRRLSRLSFSEMGALATVAWRGLRQVETAVRPYQQTRYWSNVPFLHGADAAIKYSAIPAAANPGGPVGKGADVLRDDLARSLAPGAAPCTFDFALQLLDPAAMTFEGETREPSFWVENASVEWPEEQAPFHVVGRLTLLPGSMATDAECQAMYIDVTEHSTPDSRPIGGINRARWFAESASRKTRLAALPAGAATPVAPAAPLPGSRLPAPVRAALAVRNWIGGITLRTMLRWTFGVIALGLLLIAALAFATILYTDSGGGMLPRENVTSVIYADQGWGAGVEAPPRQTFYYTPQGAVIKDMRYSWFVHLEMPWGRSRFADPDVLRRYGFLVDDQTGANPDRLPIGFTKHFDRQLNEEMLDITCAACHTGQLNVTRNGRTTALRIDGGSGLHAFTDANFGHFVPTMVSSMVSTVANPLKFTRFARRVLGDSYPRGRFTLRLQLLQVIGQFGAMGWNEKVHGLSPTEEGYGRTDALARIANTVFGDHLEASNYAVGNAPVNYPPLWNIWKFDWVQYNASVSQPMARNIGEAMGTGAKYALLDRYGGPLPASERFRATAMIDNLHTIELALRKLQPPAWNEPLLGAIDRQKANHGKELFTLYCARCHGPFIAPPAIKLRDAPLKSAADPQWIVRTLCVEDIGTDPNTALNFYDARVDLTKTGLTADDLRAVARRTLERWKARQVVYLAAEIARLKATTPPDAAAIAAKEAALAGVDAWIAQALSEIDPTRVPVGSALSYLGTMIREKAYADLGYGAAQQADFDGFGTLDLPQVLPSYKPRPLAGMWASPPFLHNGSVPTVYDLLSPAHDRPKTFHVGSREFDPVKLGLADAGDRFWRFDTTKDGNHNTGHEFTMDPKTWTPRTPPKAGVIGPLLSHDDKMAIIEHLKVRNDDLDGPQEPREPPSYACHPPPPRAASVVR